MTSSMRAMGALTMVSLLRSCRAFVPAAPLRLSGTLSSELAPSRTTRKPFGCHVLARARPVTMLALPDGMRQNQRKGDGRGYGERVGFGEGRLVGEGGLVGARGKATMSAAAVASETVSRAPATSSTTLEQITTGLFSDLDLHKNTHAAISDVLGYSNMTKVQEQSIPVCLTGVDVLAKAKTGTGKTLAFLIPVIERAVKGGRGKGVSGLIISPTRELAQQIAAEAQQVMSFHRLRIMCSVGGVNVNRDLNQLNSGAPDIMVATPGRLVDLLENHGLRRGMANLDTLVLDEADQLLEMGFRPAIEQILRNLPSKHDRQTVLYSATMPGDVQSIASIAMRPTYEVVDCVGEEKNTHEHVPQKFSIVPMADQMPRLLAALMKAQEDPDHKVIVFFVAARVVQVYAELFNNMGIDVLETHSRKSQGARTRASEAFRNGKGLIMFTSDVSARGMDFPDVSLVVQVGLPADQNQYIHRLGRTARAGKGGSGLVLLTEAEQGFIREVKGLPLEEDDRIDPGTMTEARQRVADGKHRVADVTIQMAYQAWLGFYKGNLKRLRWTPDMLVLEANFWATQIWGLPSPPALQASTVGKMGLKGVNGLVIDRTPRESGQGGRGRGRQGQAGGGRGRGRGEGGGRQQRSFSSTSAGRGEDGGGRGGRGASRSARGSSGRGVGGGGRGGRGRVSRGGGQ